MPRPTRERRRGVDPSQLEDRIMLNPTRVDELIAELDLLALAIASGVLTGGAR